MSSTSGGRLEATKPTIDPRINARRIEVLRSQGRRRLRVLGALGSLTALVLAAWGLVRSPVLDLDHVRIQPLGGSTPNVHVSPQIIEKASGLRRGDPLFNRDLSAVRERVLEIPWVSEAEVTRQWPGSIVIAVGERVPISVISVADGRWMLVDREGRALEVVSDLPAGIVALEGVKAVDVPGRTLGRDAHGPLQLVDAVPDSIRMQMSRVVLAGDGSLVAHLRSANAEQEPEQEIEVRFGLPVDLNVKVLDLTTLLAGIDITRVEVLDVRVPGTPAVLRRG